MASTGSSVGIASVKMHAERACPAPADLYLLIWSEDASTVWHLTTSLPNVFIHPAASNVCRSGTSLGTASGIASQVP
jgi:hypothetical protein